MLRLKEENTLEVCVWVMKVRVFEGDVEGVEEQ